MGSCVQRFVINFLGSVGFVCGSVWGTFHRESRPLLPASQSLPRSARQELPEGPSEVTVVMGSDFMDDYLRSDRKISKNSLFYCFCDTTQDGSIFPYNRGISGLSDEVRRKAPNVHFQIDEEGAFSYDAPGVRQFFRVFSREVFPVLPRGFIENPLELLPHHLVALLQENCPEWKRFLATVLDSKAHLFLNHASEFDGNLSRELCRSCRHVAVALRMYFGVAYQTCLSPEVSSAFVTRLVPCALGVDQAQVWGEAPENLLQNIVQHQRDLPSGPEEEQLLFFPHIVVREAQEMVRYGDKEFPDPFLLKIRHVANLSGHPESERLWRQYLRAKEADIRAGNFAGGVDAGNEEETVPENVEDQIRSRLLPTFEDVLTVLVGGNTGYFKRLSGKMVQYARGAWSDDFCLQFILLAWSLRLDDLALWVIHKRQTASLEPFWRNFVSLERAFRAAGRTDAFPISLEDIECKEHRCVPLSEAVRRFWLASSSEERTAALSVEARRVLTGRVEQYPTPVLSRKSSSFP